MADPNGPRRPGSRGKAAVESVEPPEQDQRPEHADGVPLHKHIERLSEGRKRRSALSRRAHADVKPKDRDFDPIALLLESGRERIRQLLPLKYSRMKESPFAFFRGAVSIMAADLARLPNSAMTVQLCGDAHLQNLGSFAAPDGRFVFDLNDFDETIAGPWEWDVKRMASSVVLAGRSSGHTDSNCRVAAEGCVESYSGWMRQFSREPLLQVARHQVRRERRTEPVHAALVQSERARPLDLLKRFTERDSHGRRRFRDGRPLFWRIRRQAARAVLQSLDFYRQTLPPERRHLLALLHPIDVGFKVVGTGSVGLRDYVVLFEGNGPEDPIFLQIKQEVESAYARYSKAAPGEHHGQRVAEGQRAIQPLSDLLLGWTTIGSHHYLVRQLNDHKGSIDLRLLRGIGLESLATVAGELLARGHARSGDACQICGYCGSTGKIAKAIGKFSMDYADLMESDYRLFLRAVKAGKIHTA
jgi:uncharacterized protein (DUF2252 family)